jgi:hypothetical protein
MSAYGKSCQFSAAMFSAGKAPTFQAFAQSSGTPKIHSPPSDWCQISDGSFAKDHLARVPPRDAVRLIETEVKRRIAIN